jgi:outer membrane protein
MRSWIWPTGYGCCCVHPSELDPRKANAILDGPPAFTACHRSGIDPDLSVLNMAYRNASETSTRFWCRLRLGRRGIASRRKMMRSPQNRLLSSTLATVLGLVVASGAAQAQDNMIKFGVVYYDTHSSTSGLTATPPVLPAGADAKTGDATTVVFAYERALTPNIGIKLDLGWPPTIKADATGPIAGLGEILSAKNVSPTVFLTYAFGQPGDTWRPSVAAGLNYTYFADAKSPYSTDIDMSDSWGLALQVGLDYAIDKNWGLFASVTRIDVKTDVVARGVRVPGVPVPIDLSTSVDFKPWTYSVGLSYRF